MFLGLPAEFFGDIPGGGSAAGTSAVVQAAGNGQKGWRRENVDAVVDAVCGLGEAEKAVVASGQPMASITALGSGNAVAAYEQHHVRLGLLKDCIHPSAVVGLE